MKNWKKIGWLWGIILLPALAWGQIQSEFEITSPPSPVGSGARAMGTGGAFIAIADDATAASWNPAALIQLEKPEASAVYTQDQRTDQNEHVEFYDINYLSASYPFSLFGKNMIISANYQRLYDFFAENIDSQALPTSKHYENAQFIPMWVNPDYEYDVIILDQTDMTRGVDIDSKQTGEIGALAPAFAIQITPSFSMGITWNFWRDAWIGEGYKLEHDEEGESETKKGQAYYYDTAPPYCTCNDGNSCNLLDFVDNPSCVDILVTGPAIGGTNPIWNTYDSSYFTYSSERTVKLEGQNFNLGFLWNSGRWTVGGVYRSEFVADMERKVEFTTEQKGFDPQPKTDYEFEYDDKLTFPASYGLGVAYRYSDALTFTTDISQVEWNRFILEYEDGEKISPVNGLVRDEADVDPTITVRAGAEYLHILPKYVIPLRAGYFYDPQPAHEKPDLFQGFTLGTGLAYKWMILDLAFYYRWGHDVTVATTTSGDHETLVEETRGDIRQQMIMLSTIFHFK
jgi:hypothetical protein